MRGLLSGSAWGALIGGLAVATASLVSEQPAGNAPPAAPQVSAPETADQDVAQSTPVEQVLPDTQTDTASAAQPVDVPAADVQAPIADTTPAALPELGGDVAALAVPETSSAPDLAVAAEEPVLPNPQSVAPQVPLAEDDLVISTAPAALPEPVVVEVPDVAEPVEEPVPEVNEQDGVAADDAGDTQAAVSTSLVVVDEVIPEDTPDNTAETDAVAETAPEATAENDASDPAQAETAVVNDGTDSATEGTTALSEDAPQDAATEEAGIIVTTPVTPEPLAEADPTATETPAEPPAVVTIVAEPTTGLPTGDTGVRVNRLGVTDDDATAVTDVTETPSVDADAPAIERYGMPAANPENKPTVAVVLIDDGSFTGAVTALASVPFPVSVMLNPSSPDAADKMVAYRAAGIEVGILANLPDGAQPSDAEVFFEAAFAALPETVVVLDAGNAGFQGGNSDIITQSLAAVAEDGRGLVTISQGLNTTVREAAKVGVPTGSVYRDLDGEGQDARVIRRFMDQAAFRARQESGVVLMGRVRADTISALILWGTANRAGQVALVPISNVLMETAQ